MQNLENSFYNHGMNQTIRSFSVTVSVGFVFFFMLISIDNSFEKQILPSCMTLQTFMDVSSAEVTDDMDMFCSQRRTAPPRKTIETVHETVIISEIMPDSPIDSIRKMTTQYTPGVTVPPPIL